MKKSKDKEIKLSQPIKKVKMGRPRLFATPKELEAALQAYFDETDPKHYTVTGLALAIGTSRDVLDDYMKREGYAEIIKEAKLIIENRYEIRLIENGGSGAIFGLKNFGWKDQTQVYQEVQFTQMGRSTVRDAETGEVIKEITYDVGDSV